MWAYPEIKNVADIVRYNEKHYGEQTATRFNKHSLSWKDVNRMSSQFANKLSESGIKAGDRVLYYSGNSHDYFLTIFACAKINAVFIPMNWRLAPEEVSAIIKDAEPSIVLIEDSFKAVWDVAASNLNSPIQAVDLQPRNHADNPLWKWFAGSSTEDPKAYCAPDSTAWQIYTSGTTGVPKGVEMTHGSIMNMRLCEHLEPAYTWGPADRYLFCVPSFHLLGLGLSMQAMYNGATIIIAPQFEPGGVLDIINNEKPTLTGVAPVMIQMLLDHPETEKTDFSSIREIMYAGSPISMGVLKRGMEKIPCRFMQFYGSTESGGAITLLRPDDHDLNNEKRLTSCGKPLPLIEIQIIDSNNQALGPNEAGEMLIRLPSIAKSYWRKPEAWNEVYEDGWYRSGDVGYFDEEGYYYIVDRSKDMIVSGGENIYSTEVENCLSIHPEIAAAAVIGVPSEKWGEEVKAFIIPRPACQPDSTEIIQFCKSRLAAYKCPKSIEIVEDFPRTGAGKVSKKDLRAPYWNKNQGRAVS